MLEELCRHLNIGTYFVMFQDWYVQLHAKKCKAKNWCVSFSGWENLNFPLELWLQEVTISFRRHGELNVSCSSVYVCILQLHSSVDPGHFSWMCAMHMVEQFCSWALSALTHWNSITCWGFEVKLGLHWGNLLCFVVRQKIWFEVPQKRCRLFFNFILLDYFETSTYNCEFGLWEGGVCLLTVILPDWLFKF
jgi:hypothetical protein